MRLDLNLVHPSLAPVASNLAAHAELDGADLPRPQLLAAKSLVALLGSARTPDEMLGYVRRLNEILDAEARSQNEERSRLLACLEDAYQCAEIVQSATSGMACENGLRGLDSALDDALRPPKPRDEIPPAPVPLARTWVGHDPFVVHPSLAGVDPDVAELLPPQRYAAEALVALRDSRRTPDEMADYAHRINAVLHACEEGPSEKRERLTEHLRLVRAYIVNFRSARSGMAAQNALEGFEYELDQAYALATGSCNIES